MLRSQLSAGTDALLHTPPPLFTSTPFPKVDWEIQNPAHFPMLWVRDLVGAAWLGKSQNARWCQVSQRRDHQGRLYLWNLLWEVSLTNPLNATPDFRASLRLLLLRWLLAFHL